MTASSKSDRRQVEASISQERRSGRDRREHQRVAIEWPVDYQSKDTYLFAYISDISDMGIFVKTPTPEPLGTQLNLRFGPAGQPGLQLQGRVAWVNEAKVHEDPHNQPGMGIQFVNMSEKEKQRVQEMVRTLALLDRETVEATATSL